ncbi:MAG: enoyl-CoA hydratase/isomerase family protein [Chlamydiia bacterium]|nr:enoyl-CoA hydratase/isomerase family protein [Chlamydiia bacterium]
MKPAFTLNIDGDKIAWLTFDLPGEKINKLSPPVLDELEQILDDLATVSDIKALAITSAKEGVFIAGADLDSFKDAFDEPSIAEKIVRKGHRVFDKLAAFHFPTIAVINGACLGGGLELALACKYRVVSDSPKTQLGLPEVTLGIMPGWGGTQRLPRLIGLQPAMKLILTGKPVDGKKAFKMKLADAILAYEFFEDQTKIFVRSCTEFETQMRLSKARQRGGFMNALLEGNPLGRAVLFHFARKDVLKKTKGHYPAPLVVLSVLSETAGVSLKEGLRREVEAFSSALHKEFQPAKYLLQVFFMYEKLTKHPKLPHGVDARPVDNTCVLGAGTMGAGIAWLLSYKDYAVRIKDISWAAVGKGIGLAYKTYQTLIKKRKLNKEEANLKFHKISSTLDYSGFEQADLIFEAATENLELKQKIFADVEAIARPDAIIASNTSSLTIRDMSAKMKHPERMVVMHFFNPPARMPLVEVAVGENTSPDVLVTAVEMCLKLKKVPLIVADCPGFLVNRIYARGANEAMAMLQEGIPMRRIDKLMTNFGMPMGPFTLADEIGNDVTYKVAKSFKEAYGSRMDAPALFQKIYDKQLFGKKTGMGFYLYKNGKQVSENPEIAKMLKEISAKKRDLGDEEIVHRILYAMAVEAALCLEEKVVTDPADVDMALILGLGFPPFRGGLLHYCDARGIKNVVAELERYQKKFDEGFAPCKLLREMAQQNKSFF